MISRKWKFIVQFYDALVLPHLFSLKKSWIREDMIAIFPFLKGYPRKEDMGLYSIVPKVRIRFMRLLVCDQ